MEVSPCVACGARANWLTDFAPLAAQLSSSLHCRTHEARTRINASIERSNPPVPCPATRPPTRPPALLLRCGWGAAVLRDAGLRACGLAGLRACGLAGLRACGLGVLECWGGGVLGSCGVAVCVGVLGGVLGC